MPSSLIFAGLVVLWLLILVPAVARHQQEVARPSVAALSGRVLERPQRRHRTEEVDDVHDTDEPARRDGGATTVAQAVATRTRIPESRVPEPRDDRGPDDRGPDDRGPDDLGPDDAGPDDAMDDYDDGYDDQRWERPAPRYRPGRGGFDPEAAALTARARYAFRQRVVLGLLIAAVVSAVVAAVAVPGLWWLHATVDVALVGYLVYLRRQVRMEESIRDRRAARMAGTHRPRSADDPDLDEWTRRGQEAARPADDALDADAYDEDDDLVEPPAPPVREPAPLPEPIRVTAPNDEEPALPRLTPAPPPPLPAGTSVVDGDLDDPSLHDLDGPVRLDHRRASGE